MKSSELSPGMQVAVEMDGVDVAFEVVRVRSDGQVDLAFSRDSRGDLTGAYDAERIHPRQQHSRVVRRAAELAKDMDDMSDDELDWLLSPKS